MSEDGSVAYFVEGQTRETQAEQYSDTVLKALDPFKFLKHVVRAIVFVRPKCSHRCFSLKGSPLKPVQILKHAARISTEQTSMRTKWFERIAIQIVQAHLLNAVSESTVSNTELSLCLGPHRIPGRELSELLLFVYQSELTEFFFRRAHRVSAKLSEFSVPK